MPVVVVVEMNTLRELLLRQVPAQMEVVMAAGEPALQQKMQTKML